MEWHGAARPKARGGHAAPLRQNAAAARRAAGDGRANRVRLYAVR